MSGTVDNIRDAASDTANKAKEAVGDALDKAKETADNLREGLVKDSSVKDSPDRSRDAFADAKEKVRC